MKLKFQSAKRKNKGIIRWRDPQTGKAHWAGTFYGVSSYGNDTTYWWVDKCQKWMTSEESQGQAPYGSHCPYKYIKTVKAFRRRLKQWSQYLPAGTIFTLHSRFEELSVIGRIPKKIIGKKKLQLLKVGIG